MNEMLLMFLALLQDPSVEALARNLADDRIEVRQKAQDQLIEWGPACKAKLVAEAKSTDAEVRFRIAEILKIYEWADAFPDREWASIHRILHVKPGPGNDNALLSAVLDGRISRDAARTCMERLLDSPDPALVDLAVMSLAVIGDARSGPPMVRTLKRTDGPAALAAGALPLFGDDRCVEALLDLVTEEKYEGPDPLPILAAISEPASAKRILETFSALPGNHDARPALARILARIGNRAVFDTFMAFPAAGAVEDFGDAYFAILERFAGPADAASIRGLMGHVDDKDSQLRYRSVLALADPESIADLAGRIGADKEYTFSSAEPLILRSGRGSGPALFRKFLGTDDLFSRSGAMRGLAAFDNPNDTDRVVESLGADRCDAESASLATFLLGQPGRLKNLFRRPPSADVLFATFLSLESRGCETEMLQYFDREGLWYAPLGVAFLEQYGGEKSGVWLVQQRDLETADQAEFIRVAGRISKAALKDIRRYLDCEDVSKRDTALETLVEQGDEAGLTRIEERLAKKETLVSALAVAARTRGTRPSLELALEKLTKSGDGYEGLLAVKALAMRIGRDKARAFLGTGSVPEWDGERARLGDPAAAERQLAEGTAESLEAAAASGKVDGGKIISRAFRAIISGSEELQTLIPLVSASPDPRAIALLGRQLRIIADYNLDDIEYEVEWSRWIQAAGAVKSPALAVDLASVARLAKFPLLRAQAIQVLAQTGELKAVHALMAFIEDRTYGPTVDFDVLLYRYFIIADEAMKALAKLSGHEIEGTRSERIVKWREWYEKNKAGF